MTGDAGYGVHPWLCLVGFKPPKGEIDMKKLMTMTRQFRDDENGAAMVEYSILIGIITVATIAAIVFVGGWVGTQWNNLQAAL
jgi:pilus assembly protein Flp/PilA